MEDTPLVRLLSAATRLGVEEMRAELAARGYGDVRPALGYALNAVGPDGTTAARLAADLGMTKQGAAKLVGTLVAGGYLRRREHAGDARARLLTLTARGEAVLDAAASAQRRIEARWAGVAGGAEAAALRRALEAVLAAAYGGADAPLRPIW
jgi:DNA-binding MarR family transcriptional regulator